MNREDLIRELDAMLRGYLGERGVALVDLIFRYEGSGLVLRLVVDKPEGGITLAECADLNHQIGVMLDERNSISERYVLEVCSPGTDRPLTHRQDFARCVNRKMRLFLREAAGGAMELEGVLREVKDDSLVIETDAGLQEVFLAIIARGKQIIR